MVSGIVASPCVGPVLVGILTYIAKTQNLVLGFFLLFTFAMGMGVLLVAVGTFGQMLQHLPKSGGWMNAVKTFFGICMLGAAFYYAYPLISDYIPWQAPKQAAIQTKINWEPYSENALSQAIQQHKPVIIDFSAEWCEACHELDKHTFTDNQVQTLSERFVMLKVDATETTNEVQQISKKYNVVGLPTIVFIDASGKRLDEQTLTGFEKPDKFLQRMEAALK